MILCQRCSGLTIGLRDSGWADNLSQEDLIIRIDCLIPRFAQWNHTGETEPKKFLHSWVALLKVILLKVILISVHFLIIIKILKSFPRSCFPSRATSLTSAHMEATPLYPLHWSPGSAKLEIVSSHISISSSFAVSSMCFTEVGRWWLLRWDPLFICFASTNGFAYI